VSQFKSMTSVDGRVTPTEEACIPVMDRGFLYGDSIYEVFRTYDGVPLLYDEHWARFENSAHLIHMDIGFSKDAVGAEIRRTIHASGAPEAGVDVYVRYVVTRGEGPVDLFPGESLKRRLIVIVKDVPAWNPEHYRVGLKLAITSTRRNPETALDPNIKGGNYLNNVLGVIEARRAGADDCVMLNEQGLVTEASNSNVFFVIDGELVTPSQSAANLKGLTKQTIHKVCKAQGLESKEREISADELAGAEECFVTSATREVMPVRAVLLEDGGWREFPAGGGEITRAVRGHYRNFVDAYVAEHAELSMFD